MICHKHAGRRSCKGRGCERCEGTGLRYAHSVQDLIGGPLIETMEGRITHSTGWEGRTSMSVASAEDVRS